MFSLHKCIHQRKGNPIKWKLYANKANLNLSWILLSSIPPGAIFSEWLRGEYMIITSSFTYQFVNASGLAILSTLFVQLMGIDLHCKGNVCWAWFKHTGAPPMLQWALSHSLLPCSNGFFKFIDLAAMKYLISFLNHEFECACWSWWWCSHPN